MAQRKRHCYLTPILSASCCISAPVFMKGTTPTTAPQDEHCTKYIRYALPLIFASFNSKRVQSHLEHLDIAIIESFYFCAKLRLYEQTNDISNYNYNYNLGYCRKPSPVVFILNIHEERFIPYHNWEIRADERICTIGNKMYFSHNKNGTALRIKKRSGDFQMFVVQEAFDMEKFKAGTLRDLMVINKWGAELEMREMPPSRR